MADNPKDLTGAGPHDAFLSTSATEVEKEFEVILNRMKLAINAKSDTDLANKMGLKQSAISSAKTRGQIPAAWIVSMAQDHGISADWLLSGVGQPYTRPMTIEVARAGSLRAGQPIATFAPLEGPKAEYVECMDCQLAMVPMVEARLSAGTGSFEADAGIERRYAFRSDWINSKGQAASMVLMRVAGDSMEPQIFNDDVVLIDQSQTTPRAGGLFAIAVEDVVYIKMVDTLPGKIVLKSYNNSYAPLEIDARGDLADGIRIIGRAVWVGRELY